MAVFVDGGACPALRIAYDFEQNRDTNFEAYSSVLAASIIDAYSVTPEELAEYEQDVFAWAAHARFRSIRAFDEFGRRYRK
ncbi:MAG: hypothetical protein ABI811_06940 [Acidobacteriota bacterium]